MNVELKFDYYSRTIFIPDGYIYELEKLQFSFLDWIQEQPECITKTSNNQLGYSYNEEDFIKFVNNVILKDCNEKAYFVEHSPQKIGRKFIITF